MSCLSISHSPDAFRRNSEGIHYPYPESHSVNIRPEEEPWLPNKSVVALWCVTLTTPTYICHSQLEWTTRTILLWDLKYTSAAAAILIVPMDKEPFLDQTSVRLHWTLFPTKLHPWPIQYSLARMPTPLISNQVTLSNFLSTDPPHSAQLSLLSLGLGSVLDWSLSFHYLSSLNKICPAIFNKFLCNFSVTTYIVFYTIGYLFSVIIMYLLAYSTGMWWWPSLQVLHLHQGLLPASPISGSSMCFALW